MEDNNNNMTDLKEYIDEYGLSTEKGKRLLALSLLDPESSENMFAEARESVIMRVKAQKEFLEKVPEIEPPTGNITQEQITHYISVNLSHQLVTIAGAMVQDMAALLEFIEALTKNHNELRKDVLNLAQAFAKSEKEGREALLKFEKKLSTQEDAVKEAVRYKRWWDKRFKDLMRGEKIAGI
jgi:hypothetical protein